MVFVTVNILRQPPNAVSYTHLDVYKRQPRNEKRERLEQSLDAIRRKYGKTSIAPGNVIKNDIGLEDIEIEEKP